MVEQQKLFLQLIAYARVHSAYEQGPRRLHTLLAFGQVACQEAGWPGYAPFPRRISGGELLRAACEYLQPRS
jgi:hypothetical protein